MARLKNVAPAVASLTSPVVMQAHAGPERDRVRRATRPDRKWYKTARWQRLRQLVIKRAGGVCEQTGVLLVGRHPAPNSPVVDHIRPHRGDYDLFFDVDNLQLVSKAWHDSVKQSQERGG